MLTHARWSVRAPASACQASARGCGVAAWLQWWLPGALALVLAACADPPRHVDIDAFERSLDAGGLEVTAQRAYLSAPIDAIDGRGLRVAGDWIEVYEFDLCVRSGREGIRRVTDAGIRDRAVVRRHNLVLVVHEQHPGWDEIQERFEAL